MAGKCAAAADIKDGALALSAASMETVLRRSPDPSGPMTPTYSPDRSCARRISSGHRLLM